MKPRVLQCVTIPAVALVVLSCAPLTSPTHLALERHRKLAEEVQLLQSQIDLFAFQINTYRCAPMITIINRLRGLGKEDALAVLNDWYANHGWKSPSKQLAIQCICRVLFLPPPGGWKQPWANLQDPNYSFDGWHFSAESRAKFPVYPIALSDGVPFLLNDVEGHLSNSEVAPPDEAQKCLDSCHDLHLLSQDLPTENYDRAALRLIRSESFNNLFRADKDNTRLTAASLWILMQAAEKQYYYGESHP